MMLLNLQYEHDGTDLLMTERFLKNELNGI